MNIPIGHNHGSELQPHSEFLERNGNGRKARPRLHNREGKLTASQEACFLAVHRNQIGLGQDLQEILVLQGLNYRSEVDIGPEQKQIENIADGFISRYRVALTGGLADLLRSETAKLTGRRGANDICGAGRNKVHAQLAESGAVNFRELHLQKDLLRSDRTEGQNVDHLRGISAGEFPSALGDIFRGNVSG